MKYDIIKLAIELRSLANNGIHYDNNGPKLLSIYYTITMNRTPMLTVCVCDNTK